MTYVLKLNHFTRIWGRRVTWGVRSVHYLSETLNFLELMIWLIRRGKEQQKWPSGSEKSHQSKNIRGLSVRLCNASLTFNNSTFCPHSVFMCFVWIWEQTATISLYSINWLVFVTETEFTARYGLNLSVMYINPSKPSGNYMYHQFNIQQFYDLPTQCIYVLYVDLRKNRDILH